MKDSVRGYRAWKLGLAAVLALAFSAHAGSGPSLVFIVKSNECDCVVSRCVAGEQEVLNFLSSNPKRFQYQKIDLAKNAAAGRQYRAITLPVAVLKDEQGQAVARFDSFFSEQDIQKAWDSHQKQGKGDKP